MPWGGPSVIFLPSGLGDAEAGEDRFVGCEHTTAGNRVSDTKRSRQVASAEIGNKERQRDTIWPKAGAA